MEADINLTITKHENGDDGEQPFRKPFLRTFSANFNDYCASVPYYEARKFSLILGINFGAKIPSRMISEKFSRFDE